MIHTFKLYFILEYEQVLDLENRYGINHTDVNKYFEGKFEGVSLAVSNAGDGRWKLYMVTDAIKLLEKADIKEADYSKIQKRLQFILWCLVGNSILFEEHILLRMDYRFDVVVEESKNRLLLMDLYKKLTASHRFQKKHLGKVINGSFQSYGTTIYHSSKSVQSIAYLKQVEREVKSLIVEAYERDVIRYEVRLLAAHLYSMERSPTTPRRRKLRSYMSKQLYQEYIQKYLFQIYHTGDYFTVDEARQVLSSSSLSAIEKRKLVDFLKSISTYSYDTPLKQMSGTTFHKRVLLLQSVNINPILIPKNHPSKISYLPSPFKHFPW